MQSNFYRYHFGLEWEKRKFVRKVHAKRILQTAPHTIHVNYNRTIQRGITLLHHKAVLQIPVTIPLSLGPKGWHSIEV